jgi:uncharacterized protein YcbX
VVHDVSAAPLRVGSLWVHPVKGARAVSIARAHVRPTGLDGDREFVVVDERGTFLSQREHPPLALLDARLLDDDVLALTVPDEPTLRLARSAHGRACEVEVWGDRVEAVDLGDDVSRLLSRWLGRPARLARMARVDARPVDPRYGSDSDHVSFADGFPVLVATAAAVRLVSDALERPIDATTFRPNLVVEGAEAFEEDTWSTIVVGDVRLELVKPCARCAVVDVDPTSGARRGDVLTALAALRKSGRKVFFGQNAVVRGTGTIAVGDLVRVLARRDSA